MIIRCYGVEQFTAVIAGLVREGVTFRADATTDRNYIIELTGGY